MGEWEKTLFEVDEVHHGLYYAFKVEGDSMDDGSRKSFAAGDMVLVRELPRDEWFPHLRIKDWPFWVIVFDNNVRVKQIIAQDENSITLHSLNPSPEFCDFTIPLSRITRLFNVVKHKPQMIQYK
jgi:SOS-response transcriptional repressor LexA